MLPGNLASLSLRAGPNAQEKAAGFNVIGQGMGLAIGPRRGGAASDRAADTVSRCAFLLMVAVALAAGASRVCAFPTASEIVR